MEKTEILLPYIKKKTEILFTISNIRSRISILFSPPCSALLDNKHKLNWPWQTYFQRLLSTGWESIRAHLGNTFATDFLHSKETCFLCVIGGGGGYALTMLTFHGMTLWRCLLEGSVCVAWGFHAQWISLYVQARNLIVDHSHIRFHFPLLSRKIKLKAAPFSLKNVLQQLWKIGPRRKPEQFPLNHGIFISNNLRLLLELLRIGWK